MNTPVGHQSTCVIPEEAEVVMESIGIKRTFGCRSEPHIIIDSCGNGAVRNNRKGGLVILVGPYLHSTDAADTAGLQKISCFIPVRIAALPLTNLYNPVVFTCGFFHQVTFFNGIGQRFLYIHILSGLTGINHR